MQGDFKKSKLVSNLYYLYVLLTFLELTLILKSAVAGFVARIDEQPEVAGLKEGAAHCSAVYLVIMCPL